MSMLSRIFAPAFAIAPLIAVPAMAETRDFDLAPFSSIEASAGIHVQVEPGETQSVRVEATDPKDFDYLELSVADGRLEASTNFNLADFILRGGILGALFRDDDPLIVHVTMPALTSVSASSGSQVAVARMSGDRLETTAASGARTELSGIAYESVMLSAESGSRVNAAGTCVTIAASAESGAQVNAAGLECRDGRADASSAGRMHVFAGTELTANASTGANIAVHGDPETLDATTATGGNVSGAN